MNKRLIAVLLTLLMLTALLPAAASAEGNIIVNLGSVRAGSSINLQIATTDSGIASLSDGVLPDNCSIATEERDGNAAHYLRGTPDLAGVYEFTLAVTDTVEVIPVSSDDDGDEGDSEASSETVTVATLTCSITVLPSVPILNVQDVDCFVGEDATIKLQVSTDDQGTLSYQWYSNSIKDNQDGKLLEGKTAKDLALDTEFVGTSYYYCVVTNNNQGMTETVTSPVVTVKVTEPTITSVSISSLPNKLEYIEGETVDTTGLTLTVHYSNGMAVTDDEGFTVNPTKLTTVGKQTITINYQNNELTFPVIVSEAKETLEAIAVTSLPAKRDYRIGERLDTAGLVLETITNKGTRTSVTSGFVCTPDTLNTAGLQTITVSYEGKTTSFTVTVQSGEKTVQQIAIETMPRKLAYKVGDSFDSSGMVLRVTTDQGDELIRSGFLCSPSRFTREGTQTLTVSYGGKSCTMELTVSPASDQPDETPAPTASEEPDTDRSDSQRETDSRSGRSGKSAGSTILLVIIFAALVALVALLAYIYVAKKDAVLALWQRLIHRSNDSNDDDQSME